MYKTFTCPKCSKETNIIPFGYSTVAVCCDTVYSEKDIILYNEQRAKHELNPSDYTKILF
jgi:hypothetical protein